ncbi:unnamed protein product [Ceutorhynchus assimilis]|uniref:p53 DNA-binding domain-containing protein n=1 Tax=Ceutorhynchus assimilis TaxID=467358 RepID=A0A9N9MS09_9CUCU|nr:unnamed protein product [Ceutorhynchus assimilis]
MSQRSHDFTASLPLSDLFPEEIQQELFSQVGSQEINDLLVGEMPGNLMMVDGYGNEIYNHNELIHDENSLKTEDLDSKNDFMVQMARQLPPLPTNEVLSNEEYVGPHDFEVSVVPNHKSKYPWVYSGILNKVFMKMNQQFPVDFKLKNRPDRSLFIRITPQYSAHHNANEAVCRCIQHNHHNDPTNIGIDDNVKQHVIRCPSNKQAQYVGDSNQNQRLSIVFPLSTPQVGIENVRETFQFVCKSSCPAPGMQRRATEVIFTLEDELGRILGRKCLQVRVCSCPKRDKDKEETEAQKANNGTAPRGKKRKVEHPPPASSAKVLMPQPDASRFFQLNMQLFGKNCLVDIMNFAEKTYYYELGLHRGMPEEAALRDSLAKVQEVKKQLSQ